MGAQSDAITAALAATVEKAAKMLVLGIDAHLRRSPSMGGTPVLTGHARANWVPSVGQPASGDVSGDAAHAAGVGQVISYKLAQGALWLSNSAKYIRKLNRGSSKQAPAGFIEAAVDHTKAEVKQAMGVALAPQVQK